MQPEDAPPGFWQGPDDRPILVDGVELESGVPTRFFQSVDAYPPEWGRLKWRIQLNTFVAGRAAAPAFRTFYPGVEWNLNRADHRWFLTAWFRWEDAGPQHRSSGPAGPAHVEGDTALFRIAPALPDCDGPIFLRSRVDARMRSRISEALRSEREIEAKADPGVIRLDDLIERSE